MNGVVAAPSARTMASAEASAEVSAAWLTALVAGVMSAETMASAQASEHWHAYTWTMASAQASKHWHTHMSTWLRQASKHWLRQLRRNGVEQPDVQKRLRMSTGRAIRGLEWWAGVRTLQNGDRLHVSLLLVLHTRRRGCLMPLHPRFCPLRPPPGHPPHQPSSSGSLPLLGFQPRRPSAALPAPCWRRSTAISCWRRSTATAGALSSASEPDVRCLSLFPLRGIQSHEVRCLGLLFLDFPSLGIPIERTAWPAARSRADSRRRSTAATPHEPVHASDDLLPLLTSSFMRRATSWRLSAASIVLPASKHGALLFDVLAPLGALDRLRAPDGDLLASLLACHLLLGSYLLTLDLGIVLLPLLAELEQLLEAELERCLLAPLLSCAALEAESSERLHPAPREASKHS